VTPRGDISEASRILIVDDDAAVRRMLLRSLATWFPQIELETCGDGITALAAIWRDIPDLVLLDVHLPRLDGMEICRLLRDRASVGLKVMAISGKVLEPKEIRFIKSHTDAFLPKPFPAGKLQQGIIKLLRQGRENQETSSIVYCGRSAEADSIARLLTNDMKLRSEAINSVHRSLLRERPLAIILDMIQPGIRSLCEAIKSDIRTRDIPTVLIYEPIQSANILDGFKLGADDCLTRPLDLRVLVAHVRAVIRRYRTALSKRIVTAGPLRLDVDQGQAILGEKTLNLTPTEFAILELLVSRHGMIVRRQELRRHIERGVKDNLPHALEAHISNIRSKFGATFRSLIETISGVGYRFHLSRPNRASVV
jgi:DNA-binding response OmpR family regulator